ncbi:MAG: tol-pal system protein YbgF [Hyphomicrobiaceae bacterium]
MMAHYSGLRHRQLAKLAVTLVLVGVTAQANAQQAPWATEPARPPAAAPPKAPPQTKAAPKATPPAQKAPATAKEEGAAPPRPANEAQLRQRVEQLEEQLADMQVTIGTLESLGKTTGGPMPAPGSGGPSRVPSGGGVDQARVDSLETQIRALTAQVEQLSEQLRQINQQRRSDGTGMQQPTREATGPGPRIDVPPTRSPASAQPGEPRAAPPGFGSTTVRPGGERDGREPRDGDQIGRLIDPDVPRQPGSQPLPPTAAQAETPKELYETAYGYLLQQDYGAAEVAFEEFLRRYPSDRLTADAQYWLGETLFVQRRFKPAGQAFLRVIEAHKTSAKVPNSLLKLALALEQLGQKDCALFSELETRHPNAAADVKSKARALKQRIGC